MKKKDFTPIVVDTNAKYSQDSYEMHPLNDERVEKGEFYKLYPDLYHYPQKFFRMYHMNVG